MRRIFIYAALAVGSVVFAWPFVWMAATSGKLERELFRDRPRTLPESPQTQRRSPYIDHRVFAEVSGPRMAEALEVIEEHLAAMPQEWPADMDGADASKEIARGIYAHLLNTTPRDQWNKAREELSADISSKISHALVGDVINRLRHAFCVGRLRVRSYDLQDDQLVAPENAASSWIIGGRGAAKLIQAGTAVEPFAELHYDFTNGKAITLTQVFTTSFPIDRLHRIQLYLRNDDAWHALNLVVEKNGAQFRSRRAIDDADINWVVDTWQEPGPDDRPEKIRSWTLLKEIARGPQFVSDPNRIKITVELAQRNMVEAWWAKLWRNYRLTLDYIPFWRYVGTSLFLVILNVAGTLISSSLVAYSFARLQWPGRTLCFALLLGTMMIPAQVTMIPQFVLFQKLGWYNTLMPLWVMSFCASAFSVFLLRQFLKGIPRDLEDAARLDGCGFLRIYWHIMLPLIRPTLAAIAILTFLGTWNEFMMPLIYLSDQRLYPLSFGLYAFQVQSLQPGTSAGMGMLMAGSLLMTLPVIAIFFFAQRYFLQGVTLTGMKG